MSRKNKNLVIVRAVTEQGLTHAQAAARFGVTRQWVHTLVSRYQRGGPDAVGTQSRAPKRRPVTTPEPVRARIIQLRHELTADGADAGPVTIGWHLEQEGILAPSTSTIRRILHANGLHLGIGRAHIGTNVLMLIHDAHVTTSNADTGEIIAEHTIDPSSDYQPPRR
ncbi:helix-turn-helix domain-containing protein [Agromyces silvae]|uniref:helix-turn-helix domain-containing protein n=1 Tax=Agromyces silvae TaxID=3388266 RepID=UPI00280B8FF3|nr:helix-turn-helix domain-containing protein [Agromyces protaetiae]